MGFLPSLRFKRETWLSQDKMLQNPWGPSGLPLGLSFTLHRACELEAMAGLSSYGCGANRSIGHWTVY